MAKVLYYLFNYALVNILFVNIYLNNHSVVGQINPILTLSVKEQTKFDALSLRAVYRKGRKLFFDLNHGNSTKLMEENRKQGVCVVKLA